jgi:pyridoxamine 5'-phosphate oxidase-like protein
MRMILRRRTRVRDWFCRLFLNEPSFTIVAMHETQADLDKLQQLLDESYATAGPHLRAVITEDRRLDAAGVAALMTGVQVLNLATVTAKGEPRVGPVDGLFHRGQFYFGSAPNSARFRHIRQRPAVSGTVTRGEELAITVHGKAVEINSRDGDFHDHLLAIYGPEWWATVGDGAPYARIDAEKMFTYYAPKS